MRYRMDFTVYKRRMRSGRVVFYYTTYSKDGKRLSGRSTGKRTKGEAMLVCNELMRKGLLVPNRNYVPTFTEFSEGWWLWDLCDYLKRRRARRPISRSYADTARKVLENHLLPFFAGFRLDEITDVLVERWLTSQENFGQSNKSANLYLSILTVMLNEAVRLHYIPSNPALTISKLQEREYKIEILTKHEMQALFPENWEKIWPSEEVYLGHKLAACTGLRVGEVVGLRCSDVHDSYITVRGQFTRYGFTDTKNHKERVIPIPKFISTELTARKRLIRDGFLFAVNSGGNPISKDTMNKQFRTALGRIGIAEEERQRRHLSFHSWRHFFNTTLRQANVSDVKVRAVTGHSSSGMTDHYTHFDNREFVEVKRVQESLLPAPSTKDAGKRKGRPSAKILVKAKPSAKDSSPGKAAHPAKVKRPESEKESAKARRVSGL